MGSEADKADPRKKQRAGLKTRPYFYWKATRNSRVRGAAAEEWAEPQEAGAEQEQR